MRVFALLLGVCTGCDVVWGLDESPAPCAQASFDNAKPVQLMPAEDFSISWDLSRAVVLKAVVYEVSPLTGTPMPIDIGPYTPTSLGLSPEGDSLLFTANIEPYTLYAAVRGNPAWRLDPNVPLGTFAGTPSADAFGPRRVLVRMRDGGPLQEYEDDNGLWQPVGGGHDFDGLRSANLTPNGLSMVYTAPQADGTFAVMMATRTSTSQWFGTPSPILAGYYTSPQLLAQCRSLYVVGPRDETTSAEPILERYDR